MKFWGILLIITSIIWFVEGIAILFGYEPSTFSTVIAFLITGSATFGWGVEALTGEK